jgi:uncharacterized protein YdaU (DUF1376 family)
VDAATLACVTAGVCTAQAVASRVDYAVAVEGAVNYYEHHLGDYAKDAAHLSLIEDGAYRRLLDAYYTREQALPGDVKLCCKLARANTKAERDAVKYVLGEFFDLREDGYHQNRADAEIARFQAKSEKAKRSAEARWSNRESHSEGNANASANAMRTHSEGNAPRARPQTPDTKHQSPAESQTPTRDSSPSNARDPAPPGVGGSPPGEIATENPALPAVVALRKRGGVWLRLTPNNPEIIAAVREGVTLEALDALADAYPDKPPVYVIRAARREHAEGAQPIAGETHARPREPRKSLADQTLEWAAGQHPTGVPVDPDDRPLRPPLGLAVR